MVVVMFENLKILNGEISLEFDPLNSKYTVFIDNDVTELELTYDLQEGANVTINGNYNLENNSDVIINVSKDAQNVSYFFKIYKKDVEKANASVNDMINLEVHSTSDFFEYAGPVIASTCFLLILFLFVFLFHKRKNKTVKKL